MARRLHEVEDEAARAAATKRADTPNDKTLSEQVDELQKSTDSGADHVRNLYIAFLAFAAYLAVTIGGTTDEQLLRSGPVRLPILNVDLPLFAFFWIAPALFVLFHFNLLTQLCLLAEKLRALDQAIEALADPSEQTQSRLRLNMFVFSQMLIGQQDRSLLCRHLTVMGWTTFVVLPIMVLLLAQIRFVPYHDTWTTWWHRGLVVFDLILLWLLWTQAILPKTQLLRWLVHTRQRWRRLRTGLGDPLNWLAWPGGAVFALGRTILTLPARIRRRLDPDPRCDWRLLRLREVTAAALVVAFLVATIPGRFLAMPVDALMGRGPNQGPLMGHRNLVVVETNLVDVWPTQAQIEHFGESRAWWKVGKPISLNARDLSYGNFRQSAFEHADLRNANLLGAVLEDADLQGARLSSANLQGAVLSRANLEGADLLDASLEDAVLSGANLQGARLTSANLQGAVLEDANLRGAALPFANLQGADLRGSQLWRAILGEPLLHPVIGEDPDRNQLWRLADLRNADVRPIRDTDTLIAEVRKQIVNGHHLSLKLFERIEAALRDEERPNHPEWVSKPEVMFQVGDPLAEALGWKNPMPAEAYDQELASFLGNIACDEEGNEHVARGIAVRVVDDALDQPDRLFAEQVAARLTDPACAPAARLPEQLRANLNYVKHLATKPAPANTQVPVLPGGRASAKSSARGRVDPETPQSRRSRLRS